MPAKKISMDEKYMKEAIRQAKKAAALKEVPIGCVIVYEGRIIGRGYNRRTIDGNVLAHAEILAIRKACRFMGDWRLEGCTMYVTLEPCPMCAGAILNARIPRVWFGARDRVMGACGGVINLFMEDFPNRPALVGGVLEEECRQVLTKFFQSLRRRTPEI